MASCTGQPEPLRQLRLIHERDVEGERTNIQPVDCEQANTSKAAGREGQPPPRPPHKRSSESCTHSDAS